MDYQAKRELSSIDNLLYIVKGMKMETKIHLLDIVALTDDISTQGLHRGQVGTVVEELTPDVFEVEFSDNEGRTYALLPLKSHQLLRLHYEPSEYHV